MKVRKICTLENIYNVASFTCSTIISALTYVQQAKYDYRLLILTNSLACIILLASIIVVHSLKNHRLKLEAKQAELETQVELMSNCGISTRNEPIESARISTSDDWLQSLTQFFTANKINNMFYNKQENKIEISVV